MVLTQWKGCKVAFIGDSVTDKCHVGTSKNYWQYLEEDLGITALVYGVNGARMNDVVAQGERLLAEHGTDVDAIFVFMGTNDYNGGIPLGQWYTEAVENVATSIGPALRLHRTFSQDMNTFRGRLNVGLEFLKTRFPSQQIVLMTPIHRGYATFGPQNIQPDETYANSLGLFVESYAQVVREAADLWSCPLIDLFKDTGLLPRLPQYSFYFHLADTDNLHPNAEGHKRIASVMEAKMLGMPASFRG